MEHDDEGCFRLPCPCLSRCAWITHCRYVIKQQTASCSSGLETNIRGLLALEVLSFWLQRVTAGVTIEEWVEFLQEECKLFVPQAEDEIHEMVDRAWSCMPEALQTSWLDGLSRAHL